MIHRIKALTRYQKGLLLLLAAMAVVFTCVYPAVMRRVGIAYKGAIFVPIQAEEAVVYQGRLLGEQASFTVQEDKTVTFRWGEAVYGPYTVREDPTAIPQEDAASDRMTGVELYCREELLFRGGMMEQGDLRWLFNEDGEWMGVTITYVASNGVEYREDGTAVDPVEPSISDILDWMYSPELTHKGEGIAYWLGLFLCVSGAVSILFADELFRWHLSFQIRNTEAAEPSDWELAGRYIGWTVLTITALVIFITGLQ